MSRHFLLPLGRLHDCNPLWLLFEPSVTATSFTASPHRSPTASLAPSTNGPPHHRHSHSIDVRLHGAPFSSEQLPFRRLKSVPRHPLVL
jgi:hypothetical protein